MKVKDLFDIKYGLNFELNKLEVVDQDELDSVNFVSRTAQNNGVVARVRRLIGVEPTPAGTISCAAGGSVLSTFVQEEEYYSGRDLYILTPKKQMTFNVRLYYAHVISANKYKYSYGRQANKTLADIELPDTLPEWIEQFNLEMYVKSIETNNIGEAQPLCVENWQPFTMNDLFHFSKGKRLTKEDMIVGGLNYIGAISDNNGIRQLIDAVPTHKGGCLTVNYNGSVGESFYQADDFWASDDVNVLRLKERELTPELGLFLCTVIKANKFRFGYGRKWTLEKMKETILMLPADDKLKPDWDFMEAYVKSLHYSDKIV